MDLERDYDTFHAHLSALGEFYNGKVLSEGVIGIYWQGLRHLSLDAFLLASERHVRGDRGSFMPKISDLTEMLAGNSGDRAAIAWTMLDRTVRRVGPYKDVQFDDPYISAVVSDMGGWIWLCDQGDKEWPFIANDFKKRYGAFAARQEPSNHPTLMVGKVNAQNALQGFPIEPPVLIGDPHRAAEVMRLGSGSTRLQMTQASEVAKTQLQEQGPKAIPLNPPKRKAN